jgi:hypothetical protein
MAGKFGKNAGAMSNNPNSPMNNPPARARFRTAWTNADNKALEDHHNKMLAQVFSGRNFTSISPTVIYQRASEAIAGTGIRRCVNLLQQTKRYQATLKEYIRNKDREDPNPVEPEPNRGRQKADALTNVPSTDKHLLCSHDRNLPPTLFRGREIASSVTQELRSSRRADQICRQIKDNLSPVLKQPCTLLIQRLCPQRNP